MRFYPHGLTARAKEWRTRPGWCLTRSLAAWRFSHSEATQPNRCCMYGACRSRSRRRARSATTTCYAQPRFSEDAASASNASAIDSFPLPIPFYQGGSRYFFFTYFLISHGEWPVTLTDVVISLSFPIPNFCFLPQVSPSLESRPSCPCRLPSRLEPFGWRFPQYVLLRTLPPLYLPISRNGRGTSLSTFLFLFAFHIYRLPPPPSASRFPDN